jgi:signal transduction histidine kinase
MASERPADGGGGWEAAPAARRLWRYGPALVAPGLIWVLLVVVLWRPLVDWLRGEDVYDRAALQEWLEEGRSADWTLGDLVEGYERRARQYAEAKREGAGELGVKLRGERLAVKREEIYQHLRALAEPATKMYQGQLPLFPVVYRIEVYFDFGPGFDLDEGAGSEKGTGKGKGDGGLGFALGDPVIWDSGLEPSAGPRVELFPLRGKARVRVHYQLRAWNKRQRDEELATRRFWQMGLLALAATVLGVAWVMLLNVDEREHQRQRLLARERVDRAERELLEQRLARQAAEQKALELKSHLYASIGIMAGSYAHNIKNLLVRPNDLLRRCLERLGGPGGAPSSQAARDGEQERMLREVQGTLVLVTDRLQQILQTVRRDPSRSELRRMDLNEVARGLQRTWAELAADRWQLDLVVETAGEPVWVRADESHLNQAVENLLFNARDATFEMRNHLREKARHDGGLDAAARRQALIAAASWRGRVVVRARREGGPLPAVLEVEDNGAGMTEEVRRRCTETHFSTKRDNALYEGNSTGMGLGLSFVVAILENHDAQLEIDSRPLGGATFRIRFPEAPGE